MDRFCHSELLTFASLAVFPGLASAQGLSIQHEQIGCVVAERYPVINARVEPVTSVARARVYFRAAGGSSWYFVAMKGEGESLTAALPMPKKSTKKIEYYVEAVDQAFAESRTAEYSPDVVVHEGQCRRDALVAAALTSAKLAVRTVAGAPAVPAGFSAAGVTSTAGEGVGGAAASANSSGASGAAAGGGAAGGGLSTGAILGIVGAAGAAAAVAVATGSGGPSAGQTSSATISLAGHWFATGTDGVIGVFKGASGPDCALEFDVSVDVTQSGITLSGTGTHTMRASSCNPFDIGSVGPMMFTGSVSGGSLTLAVTLKPPADVPILSTFVGAVSGNRISGTHSGANSRNESLSGTWAVTRQ